MVSSMTAYASLDAHTDWGTIIWEIRSVNHKFFDVHFKLPEEIKDQEIYFREKIKDHVARGRVDCLLTIKFNEALTNNIIINEILLNNLLSCAQKINEKIQNPAAISSIDLLRFPGIMLSEEADLPQIKNFAKESFEKLLDKFLKVRNKEGEDLAKILFSKLEKIENALSQIKGNSENIVKIQKEKLLTKVKDLKINCDNDRLEQELLFFANKIDVEEEIDRLSVHLNTAKSALKREKIIGRRLDFLMQEMNREANTLASKSVDSLSSNVAVELKVLIEQIREQVCNIE